MRVFIIIIHHLWYFAHGVECPRVVQGRKAYGILNVALSERWSGTDADRAKREICDKVSNDANLDKKMKIIIGLPSITYI